MAFTFSELVASIQVRGADAAQLRVRQLQTDIKALGMTINSVAALGGGLILFRGLEEAARSLMAVTGISISAQITGLQAMLRAIAGSNKEARELYRTMDDLSRRTPFNVQDLTEFAARMAATGASLDEIPKDLEKIVDLISYTGVRVTDLAPFLFNLLQIRAMKGVIADFTDIREMMQRAPGVSRVLAAGLGIGNQDLLMYLRKGGFPRGVPGVNAEGKITGDAIYSALLRGSEKMAAGFGSRMLRENPVYLGAKIVESAIRAFESTGRALLNLLMPVGLLAKYALDGLGALNRLTGGMAGLMLLMGGGLWIATNQLTQSLFELILALKATAVAAGQLAAQQGASAAAGVAAEAAGAGAGVAAELAAQVARAEADWKAAQSVAEAQTAEAIAKEQRAAALRLQARMKGQEAEAQIAQVVRLRADLQREKIALQGGGGKDANRVARINELRMEISEEAERLILLQKEAAALKASSKVRTEEARAAMEAARSQTRAAERLRAAFEKLSSQAAKVAQSAAEGVALGAGAAAATTPRSVVKEFFAGLFLGLAPKLLEWSKGFVASIGAFFSRFGRFLPASGFLAKVIGSLIGGLGNLLARLLTAIGNWIAAPGLLMRLFKGGLITAGIIGAGELVGNLVRGDGKNPVRDLWGNIIAGAGWGLGISRFIPHPLGRVAVIAAGIAAGALKWFFENPDERPENQIARNTARMAQSLEQLKAVFVSWGGGSRTSTAVTDFQVQWQVARVLGI